MKSAKSILYMVIWQASNYLVPLVTFPYLARTLGPEVYGSLGFCIVLVGYCTIVIDWGFNVTGTKAIALAGDNKFIIGKITSEILAARSILCFSAIAALLIVVNTRAELRVHNDVILVTLLLPIGSTFSLNWCLQGLGRFGLFATASITARLISLPPLFLFVQSERDIAVAAAIQTVPVVAAACISLYLVFVAFKIPLVIPSISSIRRRLADSLWIFVGNLNHGIYTGSATLALGLFANPLQLGIFAVSDRIRTVAQGVIAPVSQALFPKASQLSKSSPSLARHMMRKTLLLQGGVTLVVSILLFALAEPIIHLLVGAEFSGAYEVLRVISPMPIIVGVNNVLSVQGLLAQGRNVEYARVTGATVLFNVPICIFLSRSLGALGVGISVVATELLLCGLLAYLVFARKRTEPT